MNPNYRDLFIHSGWLKRLNQMCNKKTFGMKSSNEMETGSINLIREVIAHKILLNLNQELTNEKAALYSTMVFPLYPMFAKHTVGMSHQHMIDIVFIHGLRGNFGSQVDIV